MGLAVSPGELALRWFADDDLGVQLPDLTGALHGLREDVRVGETILVLDHPRDDLALIRHGLHGRRLEDLEIGLVLLEFGAVPRPVPANLVGYVLQTPSDALRY